MRREPAAQRRESGRSGRLPRPVRNRAAAAQGGRRPAGRNRSVDPDSPQSSRAPRRASGRLSVAEVPGTGRTRNAAPRPGDAGAERLEARRRWPRCHRGGGAGDVGEARREGGADEQAVRARTSRRGRRARPLRGAGLDRSPRSRSWPPVQASTMRSELRQGRRGRTLRTLARARSATATRFTAVVRGASCHARRSRIERLRGDVASEQVGSPCALDARRGCARSSSSEHHPHPRRRRATTIAEPRGDGSEPCPSGETAQPSSMACPSVCPRLSVLAEPPLALVGIDDVALDLHVPRHHVGEARLADARRGERGARRGQSSSSARRRGRRASRPRPHQSAG